MYVLLLIIPFVLLKTLADNTYTVPTGDSQKRCLKCPPGTYIVKDCQDYVQNSTVCGACPKDRFTEAWNAYSSCKACMAHCEGENEIITTECQANHDIFCGCNEGFWREMHGTSPGVNCLPFLKCVEGHGVDTPGTNITDVTCTTCIKGVSYSSIVSYSETCQPCRDCQKEGWNQTQPCSVISNAECDVKTTPEPALKTTSTSRSGNRDTEPTAETSPVTIAVAACAAAVLGLLAIVCIGYKCRRRCHRNEQRSIPRNPVVSFSNQVFDEASVGSSVTSFRSVNLQTIRPDITELILKPDITLENDVFIWLGRKLTRANFKIICKSLPGEKIKKADIDAAEYRNPNLDEVITNVFDIWKKKNNKGENELFTDIYATLVYAKKDDLSKEMREIFAC